MKKFLSTILMGSMLSGSYAFASDQNFQAPPLPNTPVVHYLQKIGASLAYSGTYAGFDGYISDVGGRKTMIYLIPNDGQHFIAGSILDSNGVNVTLKSASEEEAKLADAIKQLKERASASAAGLQNTGLAPTTDNNPLPVEKTAPPALQAPIASITPNVDSVEDANADLSVKWINDKINKGTLERDVKNTAYFYEGNVNDPAVYLVADPQCPYCHEAWNELSQLMDAHHFSVHIILSNALPGSDSLVNQILGNPNIVQVWSQGVGSRGNVAIPHVLQEGSRDWQNADQYRMKNNQFANKYRNLIADANVNGVPIIMYVGKDGKVRAREGIHTGKDSLDAMKAFLSGLPNWKHF